jgi:hypothetical protein
MVSTNSLYQAAARTVLYSTAGSAIQSIHESTDAIDFDGASVDSVSGKCVVVALAGRITVTRGINFQTG